MIVEGTIVVATVSYLLVDPIKTLLLAHAAVEANLDKPQSRKVQDDEREFEFFVDDLVDEKTGELHTQFMLAETTDGKRCLFTEAEIELKKQVSFIEATLKKGIPIGPEGLKKICALVRKRDAEISRAKSRQVKVRAKELTKAAQKARKRLSRAA
jgi:hypothetical protein